LGYLVVRDFVFVPIFPNTPSVIAMPIRLTNRWSQPLAAVKSTFNFMTEFSMFATLGAASGGSAPSR
jgi:hypothetical protein